MAKLSQLRIVYSNHRHVTIEGVSEETYRTLIQVIGKHRRSWSRNKDHIVSINSPTISVAVTLADILYLIYEHEVKE